VREVRHDGNTFHVEVQDGIDAVLKSISRHEVVDLRTEQPSLDQVFRAYYQEDVEEVRDAAS
jgi:hypothetical protein